MINYFMNGVGLPRDQRSRVSSSIRR